MAVHIKTPSHMGKSLWASILLLLCSATFSAVRSSPSQSPTAVDNWIETLGQRQQKVTKLHFYFHRTDKSGVAVARANTTNRPPTGFGLFVIKDDPLTIGPELSSERIGYAQGMSAGASLEDIVLMESFTFVFTDAAHNGSSLAVVGSNPIMQEYREMPVVGGSGVFRLARGVVTYRTVLYDHNMTSSRATVEVNVVALHF